MSRQLVENLGWKRRCENEQVIYRTLTGMEIVICVRTILGTTFYFVAQKEFALRYAKYACAD